MIDAFIYVACAHIADSNESIYGFRVKDEKDDRFEKARLAHGGTLYLESIETLSEYAQHELASFLAEAAAQRADGTQPNPDVRVIAYVSERDASDASNRGLSDELQRSLGIHRLTIPSLGDRRDDITTIAQSIINRRARSAGKVLDGLSSEAEEMLQQYSWPGNVRELQSVVERAVMLASGTKVDIPQELLREGRRVGGYTLQRQLGAGGMGEVWLAQHSLLARPSAVKLIRHSALRKDAGSREMLEERFQREAKSTAQLRSPHTVELYDFGVTDEGDFYYVMEYLNGVDLHSLVKDFGPVDPARAVHLLKQACESLGEAHLAGLVHRDIKPDNLFACQLGIQYDFLKLLDFGIVRNTTDVDQTETSTGQIKGTPSCISPEAAQGEQVTFASDIYGLGCVAYWLLTGRHVFEAPSVMATLLQHVSKQPQPLSDFRKDLPDELEMLVLGCLAKNPSARPANALDLGEHLAELRLEQPWDNRLAKRWWNVNLPAEGKVSSSSDTSFAIRFETSSALETEHASESTLLQWTRGELPAKRAAFVEQHLKGCDTCARKLAQLGESDDRDGIFVNRVPETLDSRCRVQVSADSELRPPASEDGAAAGPKPNELPNAATSADPISQTRLDD